MGQGSDVSSTFRGLFGVRVAPNVAHHAPIIVALNHLNTAGYNFVKRADPTDAK
jgi:hypothetical protein